MSAYYYTDDEFQDLQDSFKHLEKIFAGIAYRTTHRKSPPYAKSVTDYERRRDLALQYPEEYFKVDIAKHMVYIARKNGLYRVESYNWIPPDSVVLCDSRGLVFAVHPADKPGQVPYFTLGDTAEFSTIYGAFCDVGSVLLRLEAGDSHGAFCNYVVQQTLLP